MRKALSVLMAACGLLSGLAGVWSSVHPDLPLLESLLAWHARGYRTATLVVERVVEDGGPTAQGTIDGRSESLSLRRERVAPPAPGERLRVLLNPSLSDGRLRGRSLRVLEYEDDFVARRRQELVRRATRSHGPGAALVVATLLLGWMAQRTPWEWLVMTFGILGLHVLVVVAIGIDLSGPGAMFMAGWGTLAWIVSLPGILVLFAGHRAIRRYRRKRRGDALRRWAERLGLLWLGDEGQHLTKDRFPLCWRDRSPSTSSMMQGERDGLSVSIFDLTYVVGAGAGSRTQTVARLAGVDLGLPVFDLGPQSVKDDLLQLFGRKDVDFESHPSFSHHYTLRGPSEVAIRQAFERSGVLDYWEDHRGWIVESLGDRIILYREGVIVKPRNVARFLSQAVDVGRVLRGRVG